MKFNSLPTSYIEPKQLEIASNILVNVKAILEVNGHIPILIGDGEKPRIWLYIPANKEGTEWHPLIKDNFSTNKNVVVSGKKNSIAITTPQGSILECEKRSDGVVEVSKLDLRPIGLDFVASGNEIKFMGNTYSGNTFTNVRVMFGIGNA